MKSPQTENSDNGILTGLGLIMAFGFAALPLTNWLDEFADVRHLVRYEFVWWALIIFMLLFVKFAEQRDLSSIGLVKPKGADIGLAVLAGVFIVIGFAVIFFGLFPLLHISEDAQVSQLAATPFWWRAVSVVRAAVGEEILFRGYGIERLGALLKNIKLAGLISWLIFTAEHLGAWSWSHLLIAGFGGLILTLLYLRKRNLWLTMIAHFIVDAVSVLA